jgi:phosphatidylserine/phosphatidylglycerophosphate/cardiolipin synthase-like enzyme
MIKPYILGIIIILIAGAALFIVYDLTASATYSPAQAGDGDQPRPSHQVCFTPDADCEAVIVRTIGDAMHRIHVQAYLFTDEAIARALEEASQRHRQVIVLFDKRERSQPGSVAPELVKAGVKVFVDNHPAIAHNKTIIIDPASSNPIVETGSFNFTYSAEHRNAENVLIVRDDHSLAAKYERYFQQRLAASEPWKRGG